MGIGLNNAIKRGATCGAIVGVHNATGRLSRPAKLMLKSGKFHNAESPEDQGIRYALVELGYIKRKWLFWWDLTELGHTALQEREEVRTRHPRQHKATRAPEGGKE